MQPIKERLSVLYDSYMTKQLKNWKNAVVYQGVVVFQLYYWLWDVVVEKRDQQTSFIMNLSSLQW